MFKKFSILFTCIGRRVSLLEGFGKAAKRLKVDVCFIGADANELSAALQLCDKKYIVKPIKHPDYVKELLGIVKRNKVKLLVPTIDTDLLILAKNKAKFASLGCCVLVSEPAAVSICQDKRRTHKFLSKNGFNTPDTIAVATALRRKGISWPCLLKPWDGAASKGVTTVYDRKELAFFARRIPNCVVQELAKGIEHTCDVFVDFDMQVRCVVPRKRIQVRSGEVSKGQVVKNRRIMTQAAEVIKILKAGPGVITLQCFLQPDGEIIFTEINPRFGGGVPLAIKAGANFPKWILQQLIGQKPRIKFDGFKDGLIMLRYDAEVWL